MRAFLLLLALASPVFAQTAAQMGMTEEEHANMHKLPEGTGESDLGAWLVPNTTGVFVIHNGSILGVDAAAYRLVAGKPYRIAARGPNRKPLMWTPPGASAPSPVPNAFLIPVKAEDVKK